jgi:FkbM family methyltransferase
MKQVAGIWIPDGDQHFVKMLKDSPRVRGKGTYQLPKYQAALTFVPADRRRLAVDVGGHVGLWSRLLAYSFRQVIAFEPLPPHQECFRANITEPNVDLIRSAVGRQVATIKIVMPSDNTGHAHMLGRNEAAGDGQVFEVPCLSLDSVGHGVLDEVDFIKIDVEGLELDVITGGERLIREKRPTMIVEQKANNAEVQGAGQWDAIKLLKDWGMKEVQVMAGDHIMVWP